MTPRQLRDVPSLSASLAHIRLAARMAHSSPRGEIVFQVRSTLSTGIEDVFIAAGVGSDLSKRQLLLELTRSLGHFTDRLPFLFARKVFLWEIF